MKKKILIADDEQMIRELCADLLQEQGYEVTEAVDGLDALAVMEQDIFDIYIIDMAMPRLSGLDLLKEIKQKDPLAVVVILTGFSSVDGAVEAVQAGAFQYLSKPLNSEQFFKVIKDALNFSENLNGSLQTAFAPANNRILKGEPILLHGFNIDDKHEFLALGRIRKYEAGDNIPLNDKNLGEIVLIERGEASVWFNGKIIDYLQKWDFWGQESIVLSGTNITSLKAETEIKARHFDRKNLLDFFSYKGDKALKRFLINLANSNFFRWRKSIQRIVMLKLITDRD